MSAAVDYDRERAELLAEALDDFEAFCGLLDIIPKDGTGRRPFELNMIQRLFCIARTGRDLVLKARQIGFSTVELARDLFHFLTVPGASVLIICQSVTGDGPLNEIASKIEDYFESLEQAGLHLEFVVDKTHDWHIIGPDGTRSKLAVRSAGASEKAAKKLGRSGTVTRLHCTETSVWEFASQSMNAVSECVPHQSTGSEIVIESTPHGAEGYFFDMCEEAIASRSSFKLHFYPWYFHAEYAVPLEPGEVIEPQSERERYLVSQGVAPEKIKWRRQKIADKGGDEGLVDQEYPSDPVSCFLVSGRPFFDLQILTRIVETHGRDPIDVRDDGKIRIYEAPVPGKHYVLGVDTSSGGGADPSGAVMLERESGRHVATIDGMYQPHELARAAAKLGLEYNTALIAVERENHGHAVLQELVLHFKVDEKSPEGCYPNLYMHADMKFGWPETQVTRPIMLDDFNDVVRGGHWVSPDRSMVMQMRQFVISATGKPEAAKGKHDDMVMAGGIAWAVRSLPMPDMRVGGIRRRRGEHRGGAWV